MMCCRRFLCQISVETLMDASELSSRGSGMNISCSSHSFQTVFLEFFGSGAMSTVKLVIVPFLIAFRTLLNSSRIDCWSNTGVPLMAVMYEPLISRLRFLDDWWNLIDLSKEELRWTSWMNVR